jgi:WD40 repeat protein
VHDLHRFIMYNKFAIEISPLQSYVSALIFSPSLSQVTQLFKQEAPSWFMVKPAPKDHWSECLQTLMGHKQVIEAVKFSHDSALLVSVSMDGAGKVWNTSSGTCVQDFEHPRATALSFSHDSSVLALGCWDATVRTWNVTSGAWEHILNGHGEAVVSVSYSRDSSLLASASYDTFVIIWDMYSGTLQKLLRGHSGHVASVSFSYDSSLLVSGSSDKTVRIWDTTSGDCLRTLEGHSAEINSVACSVDSCIISASEDGTLKLWDISSGTCIRTLEGHDAGVYSASFANDSSLVVSASKDMTLKFWERGGACLQTFKGHYDYVTTLDVSSNAAQVASGSLDWTVRIWDMSDISTMQKLNCKSCSSDAVKPRDQVNSASRAVYENDGRYPCAIAISHNQAWLASMTCSDIHTDHKIKIWDTNSGECVKTVDEGRRWREKVIFDTDDASLQVGDATIDLSELSTSTPEASGVPFPILEDHVLALSKDVAWITCNQQNQVWLPADYRAACYAVAGTRIAIGTPKGDIYMFRFDHHEFCGK